jgi:N-acetylglucosamine-6-sulfatase
VAADPEISRRALLMGTVALGAGLALGAKDVTRPAWARDAARPARKKPNVVVITADDMRADEAPYMPNLQRMIAGQGTKFTAARHNISLCSPARAGFLTGRYSIRHQVRSQRDSFSRFNDVQKTLPVWMQSAGYHTGIIGKYFTTVEATSSPPGWDFRRQLAEKNQNQYGYQVWDGKAMDLPRLDQGHYLRRQVLDFLAGAPEPFFLWFTPTADHSAFEAPPDHQHDNETLEWPDRREADVSDKPAWIQRLPPVADDVIPPMRQVQRLRVRELLGLDDTIAAIVRALGDKRALADTVIIFTSDNGVTMGEHRFPPGSKNLPYEPAVLVPCMVRGPGFTRATIDQPVHMSIDLTATCVELADATPDFRLDGTSLTRVVAAPHRFDDRQLLYDRDNRDGYVFVPRENWPPPAAGVFTRNRKLVRYQQDPHVYELYDLDADPGELQNVADDPAYADERADLEATLDRMLSA